jgi:hypothetical protein
MGLSGSKTSPRRAGAGGLPLQPRDGLVLTYAPAPDEDEAPPLEELLDEPPPMPPVLDDGALVAGAEEDGAAPCP